MNKGENGEICVIKMLITIKDDYKKLINIFGEDAVNGIEIYNMTTLEPISNINSITKSKSISKSDCLIKIKKINKFIYISIKCHHGSSPSIINHTPRSAKVFQINNVLYSELNNLDKLIELLNIYRKEGIVGEDICINKIVISDDIKNSLISTIRYFMFDGSGSKLSKYPCTAILEVTKPSDILTYKYTLCDTINSQHAYINSIYDRVVISMRDKGMPTKRNILCEPWIFKHNKQNIIKYKGSLHIGKNVLNNIS